ncbi:MAG: Fic family protein [Bdellovibrionota bacterium]
MRNMYNLLTAVVIFGALQSIAYGAGRTCKILLSKEDVKETEVLNSDYTFKLKSKFSIDKKRLKENGFEVTKDGRLYDISGGKNSFKLVGSLKMYEPSYVFEWAGKESSKTWIERGGILSWEMKEILRSSGQAVNGKGYYVSMDLLDSRSYGDAVTAFKINRPLATLYNVPREFRDEPQYVERLKRAGLDAFSNNATWLAIFNSEVLRDPTAINSQVLNQIGVLENNIQALVNIQIRLEMNASKYKHFIHGLEDSHILKKILGKNGLQELSESEKDGIFQYFRTPKRGEDWSSLGLYKFAKKIAAEKAQRYIESNSAGDVAAGLKIILDFKLFENKNFAAKVFSLLNKNNNLKTYGDLLEVFDLRSVLLASENRHLNEEIPSFDKMKEVALNWNLTKERIDKTANMSIKQLFAIAHPGENIENSYRKGPVFMGSDVNTSKNYLEAHETLVKNLEYNQFLSTNSKKSNTKNGIFNLYVEYPTVKNYHKYQGLLSDNLVSRLREVGDLQKVDFESPKIQKLNQDLINDLMQFIFDKNKRPKLAEYLDKKVEDITALDVYTLFMSIHPFEDGNGRLGRMLYYSFNKAKELKTYETLVMPIFDLDLFSKPSERLKYLFLGHFFKTYIQKAQTDAEFIKRTREAMNMLKNTDKEVNDIFPDLAEVGGRGP